MTEGGVSSPAADGPSSARQSSTTSGETGSGGFATKVKEEIGWLAFILVVVFCCLGLAVLAGAWSGEIPFAHSQLSVWFRGVAALVGAALTVLPLCLLVAELRGKESAKAVRLWGIVAFLVVVVLSVGALLLSVVTPLGSAGTSGMPTAAPGSLQPAVGPLAASATCTPGPTYTPWPSTTCTAGPTYTPFPTYTPYPAPQPMLTCAPTPTPESRPCDARVQAVVLRAIDTQAAYMGDPRDKEKRLALEEAWGGASLTAQLLAQQQSMPQPAARIQRVDEVKAEGELKECRIVGESPNGWLVVKTQETWTYKAKLSCTGGTAVSDESVDAFSGSIYYLQPSGDILWRISNYIAGPREHSPWNQCSSRQIAPVIR